MNILVTYITVCLNSEKYLGKCLKSIISQKNKNTEYVVIDGQSSDNTLKIINKFKNKIDYFKSKKDNGIYHAMNKAVFKSKGKYLCFVNSDDWLNNGSNKKIFKEIKKNSNIDIFYGNQKIYRNNKFLYDDIADHKKLNTYMSLSHQSCYIKKKLFKKKKYSTFFKLSSDYDFFFYFYIKNFHFKKIDYSFSSFRTGGLSSNTRLMMREFFLIQKKYNNIFFALINFFNRYKITFIKLGIKKMLSLVRYN